MMKRITKIIITVFLVVSMISATAMAAEPTMNYPDTANAAVQPRSATSFDSRSVSSGKTTAFPRPNGSHFTFISGFTATFKYSLNKSASVSVYFHNISTGSDTLLYTGSSTTKTVYYTPSSQVSGYFTIKNNSSGSVTISSISLNY